MLQIAFTVVLILALITYIANGVLHFVVGLGLLGEYGSKHDEEQASVKAANQSNKEGSKP